MVCSWNVRGLGDVVKCGDILAELLASNPNLVLLQETKLSDISKRKMYSFLPRRLNSTIFSAANGSSGGMLIAWSDSLFNILGSSSTPNTVSVHLASTFNNSFFFVTNVYAPASPDLRPAFLDEIKSIDVPRGTPWMIAGDFNMIRYSHEKNNANFRLAEAEAFNQCVDDMNLIELPLIDRSYTWSNKRSTPTLERLDRVFINLAWDEILPSTILSSLTRTTSDHVPLRVDVSTVIPKSNLFRFENYWVKAAGFQDVLTSVWACRTNNNDTSAIVAAKLKETRRAIREWRKQIPRIAQRETDCRIVINLLDRVEEARPLSLYQNLPSER
jgi:exonuclease III